MRPHPDFAEVAVPREAVVAGLRLQALGLADLDEDLAAVIEAGEAIVGVFGDDWPRGLTREADALDLAWHEKEFALRRSFAWIVRRADGLYAGCAYLTPEIGARGRADAHCWFVPGRVAVPGRAAFHEAFAGWLSALAGPDVRVTLAGPPGSLPNP